MAKDGQRIGGIDNPPGFEYAQRVAEAFQGALAEQGRTYAEAWKSIRQGAYSHQEMMKSSASVFEAYLSAYRTIAQGPFVQDVPQWTYFVIDQKDPNKYSHVNTIALPRKHSLSEQLHCTALGSLLQKKAIEDALSAQWASGDALTIEIDPEKVEKDHPKGEYIGFVHPEPWTAGPPVAVVMLKVE